MRKLTVLAVGIILAGLVSVAARAEEGSELEISGNLTTVTAWQKANTGGSARANPVRGGLLGDNLMAQGANGADIFGFFVDQVELDVAKSFGENIRIRGDLDFTPLGPGKAAALGGTTDVGVEQAYATANIPAGNGVELLVGRFNSGIGSDPIDRNELKTISFGMPHRTLLPHDLTGARFGYDFSEATRGELFIVNNLSDSGTAVTTALPAGGINLVYAWGEEGHKNWVKFSGAYGDEQGTRKNPTLIGDLAASWASGDAFTFGVEGLMRQDGSAVAGVAAAQSFGGQLSGTYAFSDVWDGTVRYSWIFDDADPVGAAVVTNENVGTPGLAGLRQNHELTLATGYAITEGARFAVEARVDATTVPGAAFGLGYGLGGMFAYSF